MSALISFLKNNWKKLGGAALVLALLAGGWWYRSAQAETELSFITPERRNLTKTLEVSGVVDAQKKARLRFLAGGKLTYLGVDEGEAVERWNLLAQIDQRSLEKQLQRDLNTYMQERWDWEGERDDIEYDLEPLETRRDLDQSQWDLENRVLDVEIRDIAIDNTRLYAPFDGIVTAVPVETSGVQLLQSDFFEIVDPASLMVLAQVDEVDIGEVAVGQPVEISLDAYRDEVFTGNIEYISYRSAQSSTGTVYLAEIPLASSSATTPIVTDRDLLEKFRLGMNGDVSIQLATKENVLTVPIQATRVRDGQTLVDVRTGPDSYEARAIETGMETDDALEVLSGLSERDEILLPGGGE